MAESSTLVGYARVSTAEQDPALQRDALEAAGCVRIYEDTASGARTDRPQLAAALDSLSEGDVLVVWRLDRLGRSLTHLIEITNGLAGRGVGMRSLTEHIDTTTAVGQLVFHIFAALAEFERNLLRERTQAGLAAARARGRVGGRPRAMTPAKFEAARELLESGERSVPEVAAAIGVGISTLYRAISYTGPSLAARDMKAAAAGSRRAP